MVYLCFCEVLTSVGDQEAEIFRKLCERAAVEQDQGKLLQLTSPGCWTRKKLESAIHELTASLTAIVRRRTMF
jgi:hypothetical protein